MHDPPHPEPGAIEALLRERCDHVSYKGWEAIDRAEVERGEPQGRPRVKFCSIEEMVALASRAADPVAG
jgi:ferredoxin--NADP+ reductase